MEAFSSRVQDLETEDNFNPVTGLDKTPLMDLADALQCAQAGDPELATHDLAFNVSCALKFGRARAKLPGETLSVDEIGAIQLYTQESPLFRILNERLRERDRNKLVPFLPYVKLFLTGLYKLPPVSSRTVYRGVKRNLFGRFGKGDEKTWWAFSSCTGKLDVLENAMFVGKQGHRTLFHIATTCAFDISAYSAVPKEDEYLLAPNTELEVESILDAGNGLVMVQMKQLPYHHLFLPSALTREATTAFAARHTSQLQRTAPAENSHDHQLQLQSEDSSSAIQFDKPSARSVIGAMRAHQNDGDVQLRGCKALVAIAINSGFQLGGVILAGAFDAVITAMRNYASHISHKDKNMHSSGFFPQC